MTATLRDKKDIILIPRDWWLDKAESLEPEDLGWWYTVTKAVKFRECKVCQRRRGDDLDEESRVTHNRDCKGCDETFRELTKKKQGGKRTTGKGKQSTTKTAYTQEETQRELRPRSHEVRYTSRDEEGELNDTDLPDESQ